MSRQGVNTYQRDLARKKWLRERNKPLPEHIPPEYDEDDLDWTPFLDRDHPLVAASRIALRTDQGLELLRYAMPAPKAPKPPKSDSPWMDKHGYTQDVLNRNALAWWDRMTPQQQHEAKFWYPAYHDWANEMAQRKGIHPHKAAGVVAATSPLRRWDGNLQDAHNFLTHYPDHPENIKKPPGLGAAGNIRRAQRVYDAPDDPEAIRAALKESKDPNGAKKITNFHDLGVNPAAGGAYNYAQHPVVIDSWMPRGILVHPDQAESMGTDDIRLVPPTLRDRKVKKVRKQNPETGAWEDQGYRDPNLRDVGIWALSNKGGYDRMANALRHVAQQRGLPYTHIAQAGIWNRLGGTANPQTGDSVPEHPHGPLTHIQDPNALYDAVWNRQLSQPQQQVAFASPDYEVDEDWDHLRTPHDKHMLAVAHGHLPHVPDEEELLPPEIQAARQLLAVELPWNGPSVPQSDHPVIFHPFEDGDELSQAVAANNGYDPGYHYPGVAAFKGDDMVGHLEWYGPKSPQPNQVAMIKVHPEHRRQGIGDALFEHGKKINPELHHSPLQTEQGRAWAKDSSREFTPQERDEHESQGWRDGPCEDPAHHGQIGSRCAECGRRVAPEAVKAAMRLLKALEYHSPGARDFQLRDHIPTDEGWLDKSEYHHPFGETHPPVPRETTGKWYHTSPYKMEPGTRIVPRGAPSPDDWYYSGPKRRNRPNHVWISPSLDDAEGWTDWAGQGAHIYEVKPGDRPQPYNLDATPGYVVPHATVLREVGDDERVFKRQRAV